MNPVAVIYSNTVLVFIHIPPVLLKQYNQWYILLQMTLRSSSCLQLVLPQGRELQPSNDVSLPLQTTSSSQICPVPAPKYDKVFTATIVLK